MVFELSDHTGSMDRQVLAAKYGWDDTALQSNFYNGLSEALKDELATCDESVSLRELINMSLRLDNWMHDRRQATFLHASAASWVKPPNPNSVSPHHPRPGPGRSSPNIEKPMQIGRAQ